MLIGNVGTYYRITTNGTMRSYRSNLETSRGKLNKAMERVMTHRRFSSYAEDPASASKAFQLRRSIWRAQDQISNVQYQLSYNQTAFAAVDAICDGTTDEPGLNAYVETLRALNDADAGGRRALGHDILAQVDSVVKNMNVTYGENFVFAGADGLDVPFHWDENGDLYYRDTIVNCEKDSPEEETLNKYAAETTFIDIGMGFTNDEDYNFDPEHFVESSAYNGALSGLNFLGYGQDAAGDPKNLVLLMKEVGTILSECDPESGRYAVDDEQNKRIADRLDTLAGKLIDRIHAVSEQHVKLGSNSEFLTSVEEQLEEMSRLTDEQREEIESVDPADAITEMMWGNYCYQAALKIGNQVLSQSLLDYMN